MGIYTLVGLGLVAAVLAILLRQYRPEYALLTGLAAAVLILAAIFTAAKEIFARIESLLEVANLPTIYLQAVFKALGISIVAQLGADSCRDAGESAIASKLEMAGKVAVLLVSLPLFESLLQLTQRLFRI